MPVGSVGRRSIIAIDGRRCCRVGVERQAGSPLLDVCFDGLRLVGAALWLPRSEDED